MKTHVLLRRVPGIDLEPGTEIDASEWRNAPLLVEQRYLKPLDAVAEPDGQTQEPADFATQVIGIVKQNVLDGGDLYDLLTQRLQPPSETLLPVKGRRANQS
jgi:hypothetical protein